MKKLLILIAIALLFVGCTTEEVEDETTTELKAIEPGELCPPNDRDCNGCPDDDNDCPEANNNNGVQG